MGSEHKMGASLSQTVQEFLHAAEPYLMGVVANVGANIGSCAFELASLGHVIHALEAIFANAQLLEATKHLNDIESRVHILHGFIKPGTCPSFHLTGQGGHGRSSSQEQFSWGQLWHLEAGGHSSLETEWCYHPVC